MAREREIIGAHQYVKPLQEVGGQENKKEANNNNLKRIIIITRR